MSGYNTNDDLRSELFTTDGGYSQQNYGGTNDWYGGGTGAGDMRGNSFQTDPLGGPMGGGSAPTGPLGGFTSHGFEKPESSFGGIGGGGNSYGDDDYVEPPLLEELGINFNHIYTKTTSVIIPTRKIQPDILHDADLAGPIVFALIQGFCLMFSGKLHFGYLFGFGSVGCFSIYLILNLMTQNKAIDSWRTVSVLGYALLPIVLLSALTIVFSFRGTIGSILTFASIIWCTHTATRFFEAALEMRPQRYLIAYPVFLFYACFALITVF